MDDGVKIWIMGGIVNTAASILGFAATGVSL